MTLWRKIMLVAIVAGIGGGLAMGFGIGGVRAPFDMDEAVKQLDRKRRMENDPMRLANLSKRYGVPLGRLELMRAEQKSWGTIAAELALAKNLANQEPRIYSTPGEALIRIHVLRSSHHTYNEIIDKHHLSPSKLADSLAQA